MSRTGKSTESKLVVAKVLKEGRGISFWANENVLELDSKDGCTIL